MRKPDRAVVLPVLLTVATLGGASVAMSVAQGGGPGAAVAKLRGPGGDRVGTASFKQRGDVVKVTVRAGGLAPGFHGFHAHETGLCAAPSSAEGETGAFLSAGGHFARGSQIHGEHAGDMPPLFADDDGNVRATFTIDSFKVGALTAGDGSAVMIHADPDNAANIPKRYKSSDGGRRGPDLDTRETGDSGDRAACGVVQAR